MMIKTIDPAFSNFYLINGNGYTNLACCPLQAKASHLRRDDKNKASLHYKILITTSIYMLPYSLEGVFRYSLSFDNTHTTLKTHASSHNWSEAEPEQNP